MGSWEHDFVDDSLARGRGNIGSRRRPRYQIAAAGPYQIAVARAGSTQRCARCRVALPEHLSVEPASFVPVARRAGAWWLRQDLRPTIRRCVGGVTIDITERKEAGTKTGVAGARSSRPHGARGRAGDRSPEPGPDIAAYNGRGEAHPGARLVARPVVAIALAGADISRLIGEELAPIVWTTRSA